MRHARLNQNILETDILVLGAGLAGLRAAIAAGSSAPGLRVTLASPQRRPSGSSFANRNNALGMQAPTPDQADAFMAEALRLAAPGLADPTLVRALAEDAPACLDFLLGLGLAFRREPSGSLRLFPGCFSTIPWAVVYDGLAQAHAAILAKARALGVEVVHGFEALALAQQEPGGRVSGARLCALRSARPERSSLNVRAQSVIAALGGPAPLFARRICGPGGSGLAYGLLAEAGARLVNTAYLQWFWVEAKSRAFVNPGELVWPPHLAHLAGARLAHCPMANGPLLPDIALDLDLLSRQRPGGT
ncbi:MAG: FAD-binding protein, partial [Humidesulfovibrio sp.]|nr:FAD-binding protein [Humidesulfovibrio sp.]